MPVPQVRKMHPILSSSLYRNMPRQSAGYSKVGPSSGPGQNSALKMTQANRGPSADNLLEDVDHVFMLGHADGGKDDSEDLDMSKEKSKAPPRKRVKTAHLTDRATPSRGIAATGKRRKSLSLFLTMPLDVLFEIFGHLSPKDLINLCRSTRIFQGTLFARKATTVWKAAREHEGAPDCPRWMSEPAWALFLFGLFCQSCGAKGVRTVDFCLMKRTCVKCRDRSLIHQSQIFKSFPGIDREILTLIPTTNVDWFERRGYYWDKDVERIMGKLSSLKEAAQNGGSSAQKTLDDFREERKQRVEEIKKKSDQWRDWYYMAQDERQETLWAARKNRLEQIKQKFLELGYEPDDVYHLCYHQECNQKSPLTERIWNRIRPALEEFIQDQKRSRLERKAREIRYQRRQIIARRYKEYQRTLRPSQWKYLPRVFELLNFDLISRHLDADPDVEVTASMFNEAFDNLSELIADASERRKTSLRALLPTVAGMEETKRSPDAIELATAVFQCTETHHRHNTYLLFGWEDISSHHCLPDKEEHHWLAANVEPQQDAPRILHSPRGVVAVRKLVELAGLDDTIATSADMDQKNVTYFCDSCASVDDIGGQCRMGYNWRAMAIHLVPRDDHNPDLRISALSDPEAAGMTKFKEDVDTITQQESRWTCAHCPEHMDNLEGRQAVEQHLLKNHAISSPIVPTDMFFFQRFSTLLGWYPYLMSESSK